MIERCVGDDSKKKINQSQTTRLADKIKSFELKYVESATYAGYTKYVKPYLYSHCPVFIVPTNIQ